MCIRDRYLPVHQRLLPLDDAWRRKLVEFAWPTKPLPEVMGGRATLRALIREYLFVTLFRACAESLASENASRLAAMERADRNIDELLGDLNASFHRLRQGGIDAELFDVISGFEALAGSRRPGKRVAINASWNCPKGGVCNLGDPCAAQPDQRCQTTR